jgi:membrane-associated phospholipid phosphatase
VVLSAAIVIACLLTSRLNGAVLAAAAVPVAVGLDEGLLKPLVHRTYLGTLTYPSGHTTAMFALAATVTVLLLVPPQPAYAGVLRVLIPASVCVLACVVAIAVIALRWHYFTDTVAGAAVGVGTVCGLALILDLPAVRRFGYGRSGKSNRSMHVERKQKDATCGPSRRCRVRGRSG